MAMNGNGSLSSFCCSITPFDAQGRLDEAAWRAHVARIAESGLGLYVGGSSPGEGYAMSEQEIETILRIAVEVAGNKIPVRAMGVEPRDAAQMVRFIKMASQTGVQGIQIYSLDVGHGWKPGPRELEAYFRAALEATTLPAILSSHAFMGYNVPIDMIERLAADYPHLIGVNLTTPDILHLTEAVNRLRPRLEIHVGGPMHALTGLALGANGFLSSEANMAPNLCHDVIRHYAAGRHKEAEKAYAGVMSLMVALTSFPGASVRRAKAAMRLLGHQGTYPRGPYLPVEQDDLAPLAAALDSVAKRFGAGELVRQ